VFDFASTSYGGMVLSSWNTTNAVAPLFLFEKSGHGTMGSHTIVADGEVLGHIQFRGSDGSGFEDAVGIRGIVDGTPGDNDMPGALIFQTTADGANTLTERMRIDSAGSVGIGAVGDTAKLFVAGTSTSENVLTLQDSLNHSARFLYIRGSNASSTGELLRVHEEATPSANRLFIRCDKTSGNTNIFTVDAEGDVYAAGDVGIGIAPSHRLHIYEAGTGVALNLQCDNDQQGTLYFGSGLNIASLPLPKYKVPCWSLSHCKFKATPVPAS
jgi:hypothetical protein